MNLMQANSRVLPRSCECDNGTPDTFNSTLESPISPFGRPELGVTYEVPARSGRAVRVNRGEVLRVTNTHGTQVCDLWAFNAENLSEFYSSEHTRGSTYRVNPQAGDVLLSNRRHPILTFLEDTSPGIHDTIIAACDLARYRVLGHDGYHDNCSDNLRQALMAIGLRTGEIPQPFNVWMNIPIHNDGAVTFEPCLSKPGDYVDFRAEMDCIVVMSACPMDINNINGLKTLELHFSVHAEHASIA
ncbi:urea carboxylase-associated family protein [Lampropedia aestuarii]|uniref:urea carboxylase-associated family protein n=1 Tax=Lampropedia aestuarii TaxID=2562762 RepID=UPI002468668B|nr:urea carboxylase-associated family protein [Lampropedia aestuarii]MDH5856594.1 urea carboxylase-associated family protein [Lampropedia aestuarii]